MNAVADYIWVVVNEHIRLD